MHRYVKYNMTLMWISSILRTISSSCLSILTVYFLRIGLSEVQISFYNSLSSTINLVISLSCAGIAAHYKDSRPALAIGLLAQGVLTAAYTLFSAVALEISLSYVCILGVASLIAVVSAVEVIFLYKLPCEVMEMDTYSTHIAYSSLFTGVAGTLISLVLPVIFRHYSFFPVASGCIIVAAVALALAAFVVLQLKPITQPTESPERQRIRINPIRDIRCLIANRDFRLLLIPNILRGVGAGVLSLISFIAIRELSMADGDITLITAASNIGGFLSSFLYVYLVKRFGVPCTGLIGGFLFCFLIISTANGIVPFLFIYGITCVGMHLMDNAIPNMIYCNVDSSIMSQFHTWRLALCSLGSAIAAPIYASLLDVVPVVALFTIGVSTYFISILGYYLLYRKKVAVN